MDEARALISAFLELNSSKDRQIGVFAPSLVALFGSPGMFDDFLTGIDKALAGNHITEPVKRRAANLSRTFIPQVAELSRITDLTGQPVTADQLRAISATTAEGRREGARLILAGLIKILEAAGRVG